MIYKIKIQKKELIDKLAKVEISIKDQLTFYSFNGKLIAETSNEEFASRVIICDIAALLPGNNDNLCCTVSPVFITMLKKMPEGEIIVTFVDSNQKAIIQGNGKISSKINYIDTLKSRITFALADSQKVVIPNFKKALKKALISIHKDKNSIQSGINLKITNNMMIIESCDSFRISKVNLSFPDGMASVNDINITIPGSTLYKIASVSNSNDFTLIYTNANALLKDADAEWRLRLFNDKYPDLDKFIPKIFAYQVRMNKQDLINALDRCSVCNTLVNGDTLKLTLNKKSQDVAMNGVQYAQVFKTSEIGTYAESIDIEIDYQEADAITFNISNRFLIDALKGIDSDKIVICANGNIKPICLFDDNISNGELQLILPMRDIDTMNER